MIETHSLTKSYGGKKAVDDVTFTVQPGKVTGFLGPNGAGKSTTMRLIAGLDRPTSGSTTVNGRSYTDMRSPLTEVGVLLDAKAVHPGRTAQNHLLSLGATHGIGRSRVKEIIEMTGLDSVAKKRVGGFSLGMGQRLGIAAALLGDPQTLILDEPVNGLDPEGVLWVRRLVRHLASEGRTVFLSSHLMSEMSQAADHLIVLGRGRVISDAPMSEILSGGGSTVQVRTPEPDELVRCLARHNITPTRIDDETLHVSGIAAADIGTAAAECGLVLHELRTITASLEEAYMTLTENDIEYRTEVSA